MYSTGTTYCFSGTSSYTVYGFFFTPLNFHEFYDLFWICEIKFVKCCGNVIYSYVEISGKNAYVRENLNADIHVIFEEFMKIYQRENNPVYSKLFVVYRICVYVAVPNLYMCMYALWQGRTAVADCPEVKL